MSSIGEYSPPAILPNFAASSCEISELADASLAQIFKHLPPQDRLLMSEVCKRWYELSRMAWLEITRLDLSPIPGPNVGAVIKQCPNLRHVIAVRKTFRSKQLHILSRLRLESVKLYHCAAVIPATNADASDTLSAIFSSNLRSAAWDELVLHELCLLFPDAKEWTGGWIEFRASFPVALKRLQLTGVKEFVDRECKWQTWLDYSLRGIEQLTRIECLFSHYTHDDIILWNALCIEHSPNVGYLQNLREIQLQPSSARGFDYAGFLLSLPRLEVLFLYWASDIVHSANFVKLVTKHPALRILSLTGHINAELEFPVRVRYGNGFDAEPLPQLHIFVGKKASEKIIFPKFPSDAAKVYPISEPLPIFLDRADIKPIFEDVWIAKKIKEAAKHGVLLSSKLDVASSFRSVES